MNWFVPAYTVFYVILEALALRDDFKRHRNLPYIIVLNVTGAVVGLVGLLLFQSHLTVPSIRSLWPAAVLLLLIYCVVSIYSDWRDQVKHPDERLGRLGPGATLALDIGTSIAAAACFAPCLVINYLFAFAPYSP